jgi:hypothetical protein
MVAEWFIAVESNYMPVSLMPITPGLKAIQIRKGKAGGVE